MVTTKHTSSALMARITFNNRCPLSNKPALISVWYAKELTNKCFCTLWQPLWNDEVGRRINNSFKREWGPVWIQQRPIGNTAIRACQGHLTIFIKLWGRNPNVYLLFKGGEKEGESRRGGGEEKEGKLRRRREREEREGRMGRRKKAGGRRTEEERQ